MDQIREFFSYILNQLSAVKIADVVDILLVAVVFYYVFVFIRDRKAGKLAIGIVFLLVALALSDVFGLAVMSFILENIVQVGIIAIIIIFQPELRSMLEKMGSDSIKGLSKWSDARSSEYLKMADNISSAVFDLADSKTGALIVIEGATKLGDEIKTGVTVDADINSFLIKNIFFNKAPLHDGAMIIRDGRILACGCFLPLSSNSGIDKNLGTRHRAGIGISEVSDAVVIIVSEESGIVSVARAGVLTRNYDRFSLKNYIISLWEEPKTKRVKKQSKRGKTKNEE